ncbi:hypothetical protein BDK88_3907 [Natrinema hispanicum]|uniref:Transposase DDE domain-containing protein n=1 Tax=Natrinema hispanicum TaxID=392421 RepID=A0A482Y852_9EURY|nr:hypothetical protein BDK88_3907 [Natrinema hispanicum]
MAVWRASHTTGQQSVNTRSRLDGCHRRRQRRACDRRTNRFVRQYHPPCFTTPNQRCCGDRRISIRPKSRLEPPHKTDEADGSPIKSHALRRYGADAILERHIPTTRNHDTRVAPSVINRNAVELRVLLGDGGDDDQQIRAMARENGIRLLIKHHEFTSLQQAWNARLESKLYRQRSQNETVNSRLKRKYDAFVRSRRRWKTFRGLVLSYIVHNID